MHHSKGLCKLCLQDKKLIKAHIIPEGFFRLLRDEDIAPEMHSNTPGSFPKRMQVGVYDSTILCSECDQKMAPWDGYGQEVLIHRFSQAVEVSHQGKPIAWTIENIEYRRLKLFFMSVLWRASVSKQSFFKRISLGPFEDQLRLLVMNEDLGDSQNFSFILGRFEDIELKAMLDPHREKFDGVNYCRFYLPGYVAYIKVDKRPAPTSLADVCFQENKPLLILAHTLGNRTDGRVMREIAESAWAQKTKKKAQINEGGAV